MAAYGWGKGIVVRTYEQSGIHVRGPASCHEFLLQYDSLLLCVFLIPMFVQDEVKLTEKAIHERVQEFDINGQEQKAPWQDSHHLRLSKLCM